MKFVNRGYISVTPKAKFIAWASENDEEGQEFLESESTVYLIEDDFFDDETVLKGHFKNIFMNELSAVTENEELYPEIKFENFNEYFKIEMGTTVFDAMKDQLVAD